VKLVALDQRKCLVGSRDNSLLQFPEIADRALASSALWFRSSSMVTVILMLCLIIQYGAA